MKRLSQQKFPIFENRIAESQKLEPIFQSINHLLYFKYMARRRKKHKKAKEQNRHHHHRRHRQRHHHHHKPLVRRRFTKLSGALQYNNTQTLSDELIRPEKSEWSTYDARCEFSCWLHSGERNVTLASKRKMSQRHKTSRSSQSTQTDVSSSSSSWSLLDSAAVNGIAADLPSYTGSELPLSPAIVPQGSVSTTAATAVSQHLNGEFYEDAATLYDKLVKAEEVSRFDDVCWTRINCCILLYKVKIKL